MRSRRTINELRARNGMSQRKGSQQKAMRFCRHLLSAYAGPVLLANFQCGPAFRTCFLLGFLALLCASSGSAQVIRVRPSASRIQPNLVLTGSLSLSVSPSTVNFNLTPGGVAVGSPAVTITGSWANLTGLLVTYNVYGYFASSTAALTNTSNATYVIPSSSVSALIGGTYSNVTAYTPFSQTTPLSGASGLDFVNQSNLLNLGANGSIVTTLNLKIDLSSQPKLPAGTYTGVINITAQAI